MLKILKYGQRFSQNRTILQNSTIKSAKQCKNSFHNSAHCLSKDDDYSNTKNDSNVSPTIGTKYDVFTDDKATIILDVEEERDKLLTSELEIEHVEDAAPNIFNGLNTKPGKTGVFDIEDLVAVLKRDNAENIFVCTVPEELKYVDYLVVITARSHRHMTALGEFVRKMYKMKCVKKRAPVPRIEGKKSEEWMAMDLGNIALHMFTAKVRKQYDIEMLWSVGSEYDNETNKPDDPILKLFDQHSVEFNARSQFDDFLRNKSTEENTTHFENENHQSEDVEKRNE